MRIYARVYALIARALQCAMDCNYTNVMSRPKTYENRVTTAVRLPEELHDRLREAARERDLSANYLVIRALEEYLDRLVPIEEFSLTRPPA